MLGNMSNEYISLNVPTIPLEFNPKRVWTRKTIVRVGILCILCLPCFCVLFILISPLN